MGSLMGNITQPCLGRLSPSWIFLFQFWEISALKMPDSSALCLVLCVESNLLLFGCYVLSSSLWPHGLQHAGSSVLHYLLELSPIHVHQSVMLSNHFILCQPLLLLPSIFPSIRVFSNELALRIRQSNYWDFSISPSKEYSGLISFRIDWFDLAVQGTLESSPVLWFKSNSSLALSLLYGPTLTSVYNYWKNYSFDNADLCWQSDVFLLPSWKESCSLWTQGKGGDASHRSDCLYLWNVPREQRHSEGCSCSLAP